MRNQSETVRIVNKETVINRDPITGEPGSHAVGAGLGAVGGAVAGATIGASVGPIGSAVGLVAGAVAGGLGGKGVAEAIDPSFEDEYWVLNYPQRPYASNNVPYEAYQPAYRTGYEGYTRYPAKTFEDVESDLRREYEKIRGEANVSWNEAKLAARDAWFRVANNNLR